MSSLLTHGERGSARGSFELSTRLISITQSKPPWADRFSSSIPRKRAKAPVLSDRGQLQLGLGEQRGAQVPKRLHGVSAESRSVHARQDARPQCFQPIKDSCRVLAHWNVRRQLFVRRHRTFHHVATGNGGFLAKLGEQVARHQGASCLLERKD